MKKINDYNNISNEAIKSALFFFKNNTVSFSIIPGKLEMKPKKLHKKYKKHILEFSNVVYNGNIDKNKYASGFGLMPHFVDFLELKYKKKITFLK